MKKTAPLTPPMPLTASRPETFTAGDFTFVRIPTAGAAMAWLCRENGIRISERGRAVGQFWEYIATKPSGGGKTQFLERRGVIRTFVNPESAATAAITEWG